MRIGVCFRVWGRAWGVLNWFWGWRRGWGRRAGKEGLGWVYVNGYGFVFRFVENGYGLVIPRGDDVVANVILLSQ